MSEQHAIDEMLRDSGYEQCDVCGRWGSRDHKYDCEINTCSICDSWVCNDCSTVTDVAGYTQRICDDCVEDGVVLTGGMLKPINNIDNRRCALVVIGNGDYTQSYTPRKGEGFFAFLKRWFLT